MRFNSLFCRLLGLLRRVFREKSNLVNINSIIRWTLDTTLCYTHKGYYYIWE